MYAIESLALRVSIVLCMVAAVVTILYFTPLPEKTIRSCDRPCHEYDWPMICRYKFTVETFLQDSSCDNCFQNTSACDNKCLTVDGKPRGSLTINQQLPGPSIQVCRNDIVMIEVTNKIPSQSLSIHFKGQHQEESPYMDGTPMITQCPINSYTTFQYKFRAVTPGTHMYHAYSSAVAADGVFGALIVREDNRFDPNNKFYDIDDKNHLILISEWSKSIATDIMDEPDTPDRILINGKYSEIEPHVFNVSKGRRYRFRVVYAGGVSGCPIALNVENHLLNVINLDGFTIMPHQVDTIVLNKGERIDFVLKAKYVMADYLLRVKSTCSDDVFGGGIIRYNGKERGFIKQDFTDANIKQEFNSGFCQTTFGKVCIEDIQSRKAISPLLKEDEVEHQVFLSYNYAPVSSEQKDKRKLYSANNITFLYPPSPLLTQYYDVPDSILCNSNQRPPICKDDVICECVHVENVSLGASVELVLIDQGGDTPEHIFHLHGYHFHVVAVKKFDESVSIEEAKALDKLGILFTRNLNDPPLKDTVRLPKYGAVALRFVANNPGYWVLRDENSGLWTRGMDVVLKVGESRNFPSVPSSFPTCGSWVGPDFYLPPLTILLP